VSLFLFSPVLGFSASLWLLSPATAQVLCLYSAITLYQARSRTAFWQDHSLFALVHLPIVPDIEAAQ